MSDLLLIPLLALHLLCVNVASAGPLVAIWLDWREWRGDRLAGQAGRYLSWTSISLLIGGGALGLLVGLLLWTDDYRNVLTLFQRRIYFGIWEVVFSLALMLIAAAWWSARGAGGGAPFAVRGLLNVLAGTNLLYHFPFLFVVVSDVAQGNIEAPAAPIDGAGFRAMMADGSVVARVTHIVLASFAVTGLVLMHYALRKRASKEDDRAPAARWGARLALVPTVLQIPVGLWLVIEMPRTAQMALTGGDLISTVLFAASILLTLSLLHALTAVAFGDTRRKTQLKSISIMVLIVLLMTVVLRRI